VTPHLEVGPVHGPPLVESLSAGDPRALAFYAGSPLDLPSYAGRLAAVRTGFDRDARARAASVLRPTRASAGTRLARLVEEGGALVTTGQQAGLLTGPMYTVHKILTAVRLAEALEAAWGRVVLPVFWCATDDHDFDEVAETWAVDAAGRLRRAAISRTDPRPLAMSEMRLGEDVETASGVLRDVVNSHGYGIDHLRYVLDGYRPGETVGSAFREAVTRLFADLDLLVVDAADPSLKHLSAPVLREALEGAAAHEARLRTRTEAVAAAGFAPQVQLVAGAANLFLHGPAGRERLQRDGSGWHAPAAGLRFAPGELERRVSAEPERFSPNVLLRPVVEAAVLPTVAYVGGPGEIAYLAQAGALFESHGVAAPVAFPRFSVRVVPEDVARDRVELGLDEGELARPAHEGAALLARRRLPAEVRGALDVLRGAVVSGFAGVMDAAAPIDGNLEGALGARRDRALLEAAAAERKILRHLKRRDPAIAEAFPRVRNHLRPLGAPQERLLNALPYVARFPGLLDAIGARMRVRLRDAAPSADPGQAPGGGALHAPAAAAARAAGGDSHAPRSP
jgi:bacillithiol synthase